MSLEDRLSELVDDEDFRGLDRRFGRFNIFEAMGNVRRELEHSNLLGYLLTPERPHDLGADLLRRVLRAFIEKLPRERRPLRALDVVIGDLDDAIVHRERNHIDLLIEVPTLKLVVVIENKVGAKAADGQLARYKVRTRAAYPDWRHLFVFLTPDGADPEDVDYLPFSYVDLAGVIAGLTAERAINHSGDVVLILRHYLEMLRRHIVPDEELKEIALRIYERHREALDFIFESRPEPGNLLGVVRDALKKGPSLREDRQVSSIVRFVPEEWDSVVALNACPREMWTKTGRNLLFEVKSFATPAYDFSDRILLSLILGPGTPELRNHFFSRARAAPSVFRGGSKASGKDWTTLYSIELLTKAAALKMDDEQKVAALDAAWTTFASKDLPQLTKAILEIAGEAPTTLTDS